jgi:hypothetical protein
MQGNPFQPKEYENCQEQICFILVLVPTRARDIHFPGNSAAWVTEEHGQPVTCLHTCDA